MPKFEVMLFYDINNDFSLDIFDDKGNYASIDLDEEDAEIIAEKLDLNLNKIPF